MDNSILNKLLKEYDLKRRNAISDSIQKKNKFLQEHSNILEIENNISMLSLEVAKKIVLANTETKNVILNDYEEKLKLLQNQKNNLLKRYGKKSTDFEPVFECSICNDTGYVFQNKKSVMCSCLKQKIYDIEYNKSNIGNLNKENFSTFDITKYSDEINFEKYKSEISPRENILIIKKICENFINNFDSPNEKNLLFTGNTGLGKTFLSNCIANELLHIGKTVLYQTSSVMLDNIIDYRFDKPNANQNIVENLLTVDLLIIDDLGTETINSMKFTELFNIINTRLLNQNNKITKTIISTNLSLKNIFSNYEERLGSRFVGNYNICRFFGDDIRFMK